MPARMTTTTTATPVAIETVSVMINLFRDLQLPCSASANYKRMQKRKLSPTAHSPLLHNVIYMPADRITITYVLLKEQISMNIYAKNHKDTKINLNMKTLGFLILVYQSVLPHGLVRDI